MDTITTGHCASHMDRNSNGIENQYPSRSYSQHCERMLNDSVDQYGYIDDDDEEEEEDVVEEEEYDYDIANLSLNSMRYTEDENGMPTSGSVLQMTGGHACTPQGSTGSNSSLQQTGRSTPSGSMLNGSRSRAEGYQKGHSKKQVKLMPCDGEKTKPSRKIKPKSNSIVSTPSL